MKAIIQSGYGAARDVLAVREVDKPVAADNEVVVRVRAASVHPDIWHAVSGLPYILRLLGIGLRTPRISTPGTDLAGVVESVGRNAVRFKVGAEVFGESSVRMFGYGGTYAEFVAVHQDALVLKPTNVTFEQAAAAPTSGSIALANLSSIRKPGLNVLINGAGGAMGSLAIQIAKSRGARVTATDCAEKLAMMSALGADRVIDYRKENYLQGKERFDFILDVVSLLRPREYEHVLAPMGRYLPIGHADYGRAKGRNGGRIVGNLPTFVLLLLRAMLDPQRRKEFKARSKLAFLAELKELLASRQLTPVIAKTYSLSEVPTAMEDMIAGKMIGRLIVTP